MFSCPEVNALLSEHLRSPSVLKNAVHHSNDSKTEDLLFRSGFTETEEQAPGLPSRATGAIKNAMESLKPLTIHIHLVTGVTRVFRQENPEFIAVICNDLDGKLFSQSTLIIDSADEAIAFSGQALMGVSILTDQIPNSISMRETMSRTRVTQITKENFIELRGQKIPKVEGIRSNILSEIVLTSGQHIYLESSEIAIGGMGERAEMHHLFANPSLACRKLGGGFTIWNTAHIVSWSHSPKLEAPGNSWSAVEVANPEEPLTLYASPLA